MERSYGHVFKIFFSEEERDIGFFDVIFMNPGAGGSAQKHSATGGNPSDLEIGFSYQVKHYVSFLLGKKYFKNLSICYIRHHLLISRK